jgi:hypothetical protein
MREGMRKIGLAALMLAGTGGLSAQPSAPPNNEPVLKAELASLGINPTTMRRGADGNNPNAPNAANYDEAKVRAYTLPSLMGTTPPKTRRNGPSGARNW